MKKMFLLFLIFTIFLGGCETTNFGKVQKTKDSLSETRNEKSKNDEEKLKTVSTLAAGTEYSLQSVSNPPVQVQTALDYNARIINVAGNPNIDELNKIKEITDLLNSQVDKEKEKGLKLLKVKDEEILDLQHRQKEIEDIYEQQIKGLEEQASEIAKKADKLQGTVNEVNSWMGLGGVIYGLKRFVSLSVMGILIFLICFMVLRFLAATNPIASAIFSVFEHMVAFVINILKGIAPKAVQFSRHIELPVFNQYKDTLDSVVDTIEVLRTIQKKTGKNYTIDELCEELDKNLNDPEKILISELKATNKYGK
jgi:hypothetical protein